MIDKEITFKLIEWPNSQKLQELEGFEDNAVLINNEKLLEIYGNAAYLVNLAWLEKVNMEHLCE